MERNECVFPEFLFRFSESRDIGLALLCLAWLGVFIYISLLFIILDFIVFFRSISLSFRTQLLSVDSFFLNRNIVHSKNGNIFNLSFSLILILFLLLFSFSLSVFTWAWLSWPSRGKTPAFPFYSVLQLFYWVLIYST